MCSSFSANPAEQQKIRESRGDIAIGIAYKSAIVPAQNESPATPAARNAPSSNTAFALEFHVDPYPFRPSPTAHRRCSHGVQLALVANGGSSSFASTIRTLSIEPKHCSRSSMAFAGSANWDKGQRSGAFGPYFQVSEANVQLLPAGYSETGHAYPDYMTGSRR